MNDIRVVLIEDHDVVRIGLRTVLQIQEGIQVVGEASNGTQGLHLVKTTPVDVALVDVGLPGIDGIELTQQFRKFQQEHPDSTTKIIMLTMLGSEETVLASFAAGADSYCMKDIGIEQLIEAIRMTHTGNAWIDPAVASIVLRQMKTSIIKPAIQKQTIEIRSLEPEYEQVLASDPVTEREREVLELMVAGCTNVDIAARLYITVGTVKTHVRNILAKLCADDRTEAAVRALRSGIVH
ncbi:response regulator transcription factor [Chamaesiphon sp. VAR_48_metabat_403]|uniref:response regulator transcription factor n=1 Tax=Chamaesiphon sp. VAR_48_metabat_403 TaxID=2964700 RepID=UPI00286E16F6|nr:response regulator transcription factor [Chamaesiphon sp. VAR_48_metabat_403]